MNPAVAERAPDLQPVLTGDIVALSPTVAADWDALYAAASDPLIWAGHPAPNRWREPVFRRYVDKALASGGSLTIRARDNGAVIGASRFVPDPADPATVQIGWTFLTRAHWGGAANREVKALMIAHGLRFFARIEFVIGADNIRSRRAIEKIGAVATGREEMREMGGRAVRHIVYAVTRDVP